MEINRRNLFIGAGAAALLSQATPALASQRTTVVLSPHPDDEVIRLSHYSAIAADRGDRMILVQATDGGATSVGRRLGLTPKETTRFRYREQDSAWSWLTDGRGEVVRLGLPDGGAGASSIYSAVKKIMANSAAPELYVATWHYDRSTSVSADKHRDHIACVDAGRRLGNEGYVVRYAIHPSANQRGTTYFRRTVQQQLRVEGAVASYQPIGRRSTSNLDYVLNTSNRVSR